MAKPTPKLSTLPANYQDQIDDLVTRLSGNRKKYETIAICVATPSVSNHLKHELHSSGELRLDTLEKSKELFANWSDYSYFNPSHGAKACPQVKSVMEQVSQAKLPNLTSNSEGIVVTDPTAWAKAILKAGLTIHSPAKLPNVKAYTPENPIDVDIDLETKSKKAATKLEIRDTETGKNVKTEVTEVEARHVSAGQTYVYKYLVLPNGAIPLVTETQKPALVWGSDKELKEINKEWAAVRKLITPDIER